MFGRGRGRGGRGWGRGASPRAPGAVEDNDMSAPAGPPPLFPEIELPEVPETMPTSTERCLLRRHELQHAWRNSCFHITPASFAKDGKKNGALLQELGAILTLDARYFPQELFDGSKRSGKRKDQAEVWAAAAARRQRSDADELGALEALAAAESRSKQAGQGSRTAEGEEEADAAALEGEEEEEELVEEEEDDYYMNEHFDDDEGYDDDFDDGGGDDAIY